jgi:hypothetical protein
VQNNQWFCFPVGNWRSEGADRGTPGREEGARGTQDPDWPGKQSSPHLYLLYFFLNYAAFVAQVLALHVGSHYVLPVGSHCVFFERMAGAVVICFHSGVCGRAV